MVIGMARVGQQIAGLGEDRLPGQIAVGVLTKVFPPSLVDEVVAAAGVARLVRPVLLMGDRPVLPPGGPRVLP